jgi:hypothetical protein
MAKLVVSFDTYYGLESYDGKQALQQFKATPGILALRAYRAEGSPAYVVEIDVDDAAVENMKKVMQGAFSQYSGYLSNFGMRTLKQLNV